MNVFVLHHNPELAARAQCDKHVVKMPLESAQMLSTAVQRWGGDAPYLPTHRNHPCTQWAGNNRYHFDWLLTHGLALCDEYAERYGRVHKSRRVIEHCVNQRGIIPAYVFEQQPLCMPNEYKSGDVVASYRAFYHGEKSQFATWKQNRPEWWRGS